jgi:hypothetical protein
LSDSNANDTDVMDIVGNDDHDDNDDDATDSSTSLAELTDGEREDRDCFTNDPFECVDDKEGDEEFDHCNDKEIADATSDDNDSDSDFNSTEDTIDCNDGEPSSKIGRSSSRFRFGSVITAGGNGSGSSSKPSNTASSSWVTRTVRWKSRPTYRTPTTNGINKHSHVTACSASDPCRPLSTGATNENHTYRTNATKNVVSNETADSKTCGDTHTTQRTHHNGGDSSITVSWGRSSPARSTIHRRTHCTNSVSGRLPSVFVGANDGAIQRTADAA